MEASPSTAHLFIIKPFLGPRPEATVLHASLHGGPHRAACRRCDEPKSASTAKPPIASPPGTRGFSRATSPSATARSREPRSKSPIRAAGRWARRITVPPRKLLCACSRAQVEEIGRDFYFAAPARRAKITAAAWCAMAPTPIAWSTAKADLLPALVVDRYGDYLVMQTLDQGMDAAKDRNRRLPGGYLPAARHRRAQ